MHGRHRSPVRGVKYRSSQMNEQPTDTNDQEDGEDVSERGVSDDEATGDEELPGADGGVEA